MAEKVLGLASKHNVPFNHVLRSANVKVDSLAKEGVGRPVSVVVMGSL